MTNKSIAILSLALLALWGCGEGKQRNNTQDMGAADVPSQDLGGGDQGEDQGDTGEDLGDEPDAAPDMEEDMGREPVRSIPLTSPQEGVSPDGASLEGALGEGQVRAGRVLEGHGGFGGVQAECGAGDLVLDNRVARFCIEGLVPTSQLYFTPGQLIDAEPVGLPAWMQDGGRDRLDSVAALSDLRTGQGAQVEIIRDGSVPEEVDGLPQPMAVVRVTGPEEPIMYIAGVIGTTLFPDRPMRVVTEYRLRPDTPFLEVVTVLENVGEGKVVTAAPGDILFWGDTTESQELRTSQGEAYGAVAHGPGVAYMVLTEQPYQTVELPGVDLPASLLTHPGGRMAYQDQVGARRFFGVSAQVAQLWESLEAWRPQHPLLEQAVYAELRVERQGQPVPGARVELRGAQGELLFVGWSDELGNLPVRAPAGAATATVVDPEGALSSQEVELAQGGSTSLELPQMGSIAVSVMAQEGEALSPSAARLDLRRAEDGATRRWYVLRGQHNQALPPGTWSWMLSRGMEFTYASGEVVVEAGQEAQVGVTLERVVDTPGFVAGEFHQHQSPSLDSEVAVRDRVLSNLAEGVDFAVSSDHDTVTDFGPVIAELGIEQELATLVGAEISPLWGHFGVYPLEPRMDATGRGAPPLAWRNDEGEVERVETGEQLIQMARGQFGVELVQVNHPRENQAYFSSFRFARDAPASEAREGFSLDFDTMEVINGVNCEQLQDWFALLNLGVQVIGVGNSDTHNLSSPPGYPRNYIPAQAATPGELSAEQILAGVLSGDLVISATAYLEFGPGQPQDPEAARPGRLLPGQGLTVQVRALTPPWATVDRLTVYRNGEEVEELVIGAPGEVVDYDGEVTLATEGEQDAWFVFVAWNSEDQRSAVYGNPVFAIANPFYLDADEDGIFSAPGAQAPEAPVSALCR